MLRTREQIECDAVDFAVKWLPFTAACATTWRERMLCFEQDIKCCFAAWLP